MKFNVFVTKRLSELHADGLAAIGNTLALSIEVERLGIVLRNEYDVKRTALQHAVETALTLTERNTL